MAGFLVPGAGFLIPGAGFLIPDAGFLVPGACLLVTKKPVPAPAWFLSDFKVVRQSKGICQIIFLFSKDQAGVYCVQQNLLLISLPCPPLHEFEIAII